MYKIVHRRNVYLIVPIDDVIMSRRRTIKQNTNRKIAGITGKCTNCRSKAQVTMVFAEPNAEVDGQEKAFGYCWMHGYAFVAEELNRTRHRMQKRDAIIILLQKRVDRYEKPLTNEQIGFSDHSYPATIDVGAEEE